VKKILLLGSMALLALAFAIPASASASVWTYGGEEVGEGEVYAQSFEGSIGWDHYVGGWGPSGFHCAAAMEIEAEGPSAGRVSSFSQNPASCSKYGAWTNCNLASYSTNLSNGWNLDVEALPGTLTTPGQPVKITDVFAAGCKYGGHNIWVNQWSFTPTLNAEGRLVSFTLTGNSVQTGAPYEISMTSTGASELGLS
jgi:hypothetical protein